MNTTTVNQFATRANALAYAIETLGGKTDRLRALTLWLLKQASARNALDMDMREFMARCPEAVRDAARAVVCDAQTLLQALRTRAANKVLRKRKTAPKKERPDLMSDEDYAEMLQRMDPFEAARIQREE
jgi:hypothetical protein